MATPGSQSARARGEEPTAAHVAAASEKGPWPDRYPWPANPNGWFRVAYSNELAPGEVKALSYFGRDLVLYRGEDGQPHLLDAYCPHLGAHLGHGGCVEGDDIRCPFHAWRFDGQGACVEVPYAKRIPPTAKLRSWPVDERNGIVFAWYHEQGEPPSYEIPKFPQLEDGDWTAPVVKHWHVRARWLDMNENCVDVAHFKYVHGVLTIPTGSAKQDGHIFRTESHFEQKSPGGTSNSVLITMDYGPGLQTVEMHGIIDTLMVNSATPIDESYTDVSFFYCVKTEGDPRKEKLADAMVKDLVTQFENDLPIWENKVYWEAPKLCDGDGPVGRYRKWYQQFFE